MFTEQKRGGLWAQIILSQNQIKSLFKTSPDNQEVNSNQSLTTQISIYKRQSFKKISTSSQPVVSDKNKWNISKPAHNMVYAMPFDGKPCCNIQLLKVSAASPQNLSGTRATHQNHTDKAYQQQMQTQKIQLCTKINYIYMSRQRSERLGT